MKDSALPDRMDGPASDSAITQDRSRANAWQRRNEKAIGKGAFGDVFLVQRQGQRLQPGQPAPQLYVHKVVKLAKQNDWQREATRREIKLMAALKHPFIVPFVDSWTIDNHTVNVVLGYCEQGDLGAVLAKQMKLGKPFEEHVMKAYLVQLLLALQYLRAQGVLHRDIKTNNIFLHAEGHVQLGDFGLASVKDVADVDSVHDQCLVGTPHFMSPELVSQKGYSYPTDVWSLGVVMYELMSQKTPFAAFNLNGLVEKIQKKGPAPLPKTYSPELCSLITKCMLNKEPSRRYTPEQLLAMPCLRQALEEECRNARRIMPDVILPDLPAPAASPAPAADAGTTPVPSQQQQTTSPPQTPPPPPQAQPAASKMAGAVATAAAWLGLRSSPTATAPAVPPAAPAVPTIVPAVPAAVPAVPATARAIPAAGAPPASPSQDEAAAQPAASARMTPRAAGASPGSAATRAAPASPAPASKPSLAKLLKPVAQGSPAKQPTTPGAGAAGTPRPLMARAGASPAAANAAGTPRPATARAAGSPAAAGNVGASGWVPGAHGDPQRVVTAVPAKAQAPPAATAATVPAKQPNAAAAAGAAAKGVSQRPVTSLVADTLANASESPADDAAVPATAQTHRPLRSATAAQVTATVKGPAVRVPTSAGRSSPVSASASPPAGLGAATPSPRTAMPALSGQNVPAPASLAATTKPQQTLPANVAEPQQQQQVVASEPQQKQVVPVESQGGDAVAVCAVGPGEEKSSSERSTASDAAPQAPRTQPHQGPTARTGAAVSQDVPVPAQAEQVDASDIALQMGGLSVAACAASQGGAPLPDQQQQQQQQQATSETPTVQPVGEEGGVGGRSSATSRRSGSPVSAGSSAARPAASTKRQWAVPGVVVAPVATAVPRALPRMARRKTAPVTLQPGASAPLVKSPGAIQYTRQTAPGTAPADSAVSAPQASGLSGVDSGNGGGDGSGSPREVQPKRVARSSGGESRGGASTGVRTSVPMVARQGAAAATAGEYATVRPASSRKTVEAPPPWRSGGTTVPAPVPPLLAARAPAVGAPGTGLQDNVSPAGVHAEGTMPAGIDDRIAAVTSNIRRARQGVAAGGRPSRREALSANLRSAKLAPATTYAAQAAQRAAHLPAAQACAAASAAASVAQPAQPRWLVPAASGSAAQPEPSPASGSGVEHVVHSMAAAPASGVVQDAAPASPFASTPPDDAPPLSGARRTRTTLESVASLPRISELACLVDGAVSAEHLGQLPGGRPTLPSTPGGLTPASEGGASSTPTLFAGGESLSASQGGAGMGDTPHEPYMYANAMYMSRRTVDTDLSSRGQSAGGMASPMVPATLQLEDGVDGVAAGGEEGAHSLLDSMSPSLSPHTSVGADGVGGSSWVAGGAFGSADSTPAGAEIAGGALLARASGVEGAVATLGATSPMGSTERRVAHSSFTIGGAMAAGGGVSLGTAPAELLGEHPATPRLCRSAPGNNTVSGTKPSATAATAAHTTVSLFVPQSAAAAATQPQSAAATVPGHLMPGSSFGGSSNKSEATAGSVKSSGGEAGLVPPAITAGAGAAAQGQLVEELRGLLARAHGLFQANRMAELGNLLAHAQGV